jgi:excisionase family DNA binding protein
VTGRLLTARVVAELLDVSSETILRWTRRGELPAIRLPDGQLRYRREVLNSWLDSQVAEPSPAPPPPRRSYIVPLARGEDDWSNLTAACRPCNTSKWATPLRVRLAGRTM